jgi:hypothetical protein
LRRDFRRCGSVKIDPDVPGAAVASPLWRGSAGTEFSVDGLGAKLLARYGALIGSAFSGTIEF